MPIVPPPAIGPRRNYRPPFRWTPDFSLAVAAGHATPATSGEPMPEAVASGEPMAETMTEATRKAVAKAVREPGVEMIEALHDDDRRREAEKPRVPSPTPIRPTPIRIEVEIGIGRRIGGICRRRNLIDLRWQSRRRLGDPPAPVGLLAGLDGRVLRLPPDRYRDGIAVAGGRRGGRLCAGGRRRLGLSGRRGGAVSVA